MTKRAKTQEHDYAKLLYTKEFLTQKDIAERVGVTEKTISKWAQEENWKALRQSMVMTKEEQLRNLYAQLDELNTDIRKREEGKRYASNKESDTISKLSAAIRNLETETSVADIVEVMRKFTNYIKTTDLDKAKEIVTLADGFIQHSLSR